TCVLKDMYAIAGERSGGGNPEWLAHGSLAQENSGIAKKLLAAGATITGKTICDEFFYSITGANAHYGTPTNPRAPDRMPGGSSSGSASAQAAGTCDFAIGSDTGGSVRIPAAFCGLYGIRPTHGRIDLTGAMAMAPTFDVPGWFASTPGVFRKVGEVLLEGSPSFASVSEIVVLDDGLQEADSGIAELLLRDTVPILAEKFPKLRHLDFGPGRLDSWKNVFRIIQAREIWQTYGSFVEGNKPNLGPGIKERMEFARTVSDHDAARARLEMGAARELIRSVATKGAVLFLPTAPGIAPLLTSTPQELDEFRVRVMRLTCIAGLGGLPQISIPLGTYANCPFGISFIGWPGSDEVLLDLAAALAEFAGSAHA
ncbi:MAG TPA: amidase, partial [Chthoniobacterales bacterium]|nr:amidase [Chthoniobacterales bacterium]